MKKTIEIEGIFFNRDTEKTHHAIGNVKIKIKIETSGVVHEWASAMSKEISSAALKYSDVFTHFHLSKHSEEEELKEKIS